MGRRWGFEGKAYWGVVGVEASNEITNVEDITVGLKKQTDDATTRLVAENGFMQMAVGLIDHDISFTMLWDDTDAAFNAVITSFFNISAPGISFKFLDVASGQGPAGDYEVHDISKAEPKGALQRITVTAKPAYSTANPVAWTS